MTDSSEGETVKCPACQRVTPAETYSSMGMVLSAADALVQADSERIIEAMEASTQSDFHVSVTMFVEVLEALCQWTGMPFDQTLLGYRKEVNRAIQQAVNHG